MSLHHLGEQSKTRWHSIDKYRLKSGDLTSSYLSNRWHAICNLPEIPDFWIL
jgi:hypothetical protein